MATAAPAEGMPIFYNSVEPINLDQHGKMKIRGITTMPEAGRAHAVPLTVDEFTLVQRHYPIVFSVGGTPVPIALMGLNEGVNVFLDENGRALDPSLYIPAYLRRYPFLLAALFKARVPTPNCTEIRLGERRLKTTSKTASRI